MPSRDSSPDGLEQLTDRMNAMEAVQAEHAKEIGGDGLAEFHQALRDFSARERAAPRLRADFTFEQNQALFRGWLKWRFPDREERLAYLRAEVGR